ncbi:aromatic-ring-hydroxylating dioxygenase subunit beta [Polaromonas sp.]|uniref:aromatic-ring-hydroxylating dioxygenase subunit beta n=1 Tax=Polaromonas sp. TaxID=1869339 RepID=UPI00326691AE
MNAVTLERLQLQYEVDQLYAAYAAALDEKCFDAWPEFFLEDGRYTVQARENFERGLPLALMDLESRGMMKDRVYGITQTIYHGPYYTRHVLSPAQVISSEGDVLTSQANYAVFRTRPAGVSEVYNVGRYLDELQRTGDGLKFRRRLCVYDSEMILNSLIYPV